TSSQLDYLIYLLFPIFDPFLYGYLSKKSILNAIFYEAINSFYTMYSKKPHHQDRAFFEQYQ
ncbi:hypothetical protein ACWJFE_003298, partial [Acinetobacter baumannii]